MESEAQAKHESGTDEAAGHQAGRAIVDLPDDRPRINRNLVAFLVCACVALALFFAFEEFPWLFRTFEF